MLNRSFNSKKIGVIVPSFFEAQFIKRVGMKNTTFGVSGMGKLRASWAVRTMVKDGCKAILLTGFAGGLQHLKKGDVVTAIKVIEGDYDTRPLESFPNSIFTKPLQIANSKMCFFVSQDKFLTKNIYAETNIFENGGEHRTMATDMEAYAVAFAGKSLDVPVFIVKMISDTVDGDSEKDFLSACSQMSDRLNEVISESISLIRKEIFNESVK